MKRLSEYLDNVSKFLSDSKDEATEWNLVRWLIKNPNPTDKAVHDLADHLGKEIHTFEAEFYKLASIGALIMHKEYDTSKFDKTELEEGIKVEMEHLPKDGDEKLKKLVATTIASAHLDESKMYYAFLEEMEKELKSMKGKNSDN